MTNIQVTIGGAAVALGTGTATNLSTGGKGMVLYQGNTLIASANDGGVSPDTINGLTTTGSIYPGSVQAGGTAAAGTGFSFVTAGPGGTLQSPPFDVVAAGPPTPAAPTFGATTTGVTTLPVNTQALTASATSEIIQVAADAAFANPIAGNPFAVPTPGTAVSVTGLASGQTYYVRVGMTNSAGTAFGPSQQVLFDVTGPVYQSCAISASGTVVTLTNTDYSPPIQAGTGTPTLLMSGGAVALSNPVYGPTTVQYTASRTIYAGETGTVTIPSGAYKDSASPTSNNVPAIAAQLVTNGSTQPQPVPSNPQHLFSSGTLTASWTDSQGNPQSAVFATVQDITTDLGFDRKELWDATINSIFPIDSADSQGKLTFKIGSATISSVTLQRIVAGQLATAGSTQTLTLPQSVKLPAFQAVLVLVDTKGRTITVSLNLVKAKGVQLPFKINDFVIQGFELDCYPDPVTGIIGTWAFNG